VNRVTKNIIANYIGKLWGFISIFIFVRFYIDILGVESYAIINFYTVILGLLAFADAGLTATLTRELARDISIAEKSNLVHTFERIYVFICLCIAIFIIFSANVIANSFLASSNYTPTTVANYLRLIGVGVALQLFSTLYEGGVNGLQQQVLTNKIRIIWSFFRSGVVLVPIYFFPKLEIYFIWQVICNLIILLVLRNSLLRLLPNQRPIFSVSLIKSTGKYALGMMGIAFISAINIQIDKLVTSKYLTMEQFGYYSIASTLAQLPTMVVMPIVTAVFPLLSLFVSQNDIVSTVKTFHKYSFLITTIATPIAMCIGLYSVSLITLWTGKPEIAQSTEYVVKMLVIGGLFLCMQFTVFYLALANGYTKINLYTGIVCLIIVIPLIIYSITNFGMIGATFPWVLINVSSFFLIGIHIVTKFLPKQLSSWLIWDVFLPIIVTLIVVILIEMIFFSFNSIYVFFVKSVSIGVLSFVFNVFIFNQKNPENEFFNYELMLKKIRGKLSK